MSPWQSPRGKGGVHVSRRSDGSTRIVGMREHDPTPPSPADLKAEEFDRISALMAEAPHGIVGAPEWLPRLVEDENA